MTDWRSVMRDAAERDEQDQLSPQEAQAMRWVVLAAVANSTPGRARAVWLRRPVLVATTIVAIISVGVAAGLRVDFASRSQPARPMELVALPASVAPETADMNPQNRQLQFKTAGGTRIIWVFNSDLDLKATLR
jgi:hypothetical protein